jgi:hypothetical protein
MGAAGHVERVVQAGSRKNGSAGILKAPGDIKTDQGLVIDNENGATPKFRLVVMSCPKAPPGRTDDPEPLSRPMSFERRRS